ncbi:hypothetical protein KDD30_00770 [Photobacterium sp. GJ3]|uniref:hypothetical protein n=1 Tax=Photobacterium sp. GJ3 TaxID=2829502 RepID=UPI001B8D5E36|nr:hypothetical protein [Photobacterium sp. GJ3]QUJ67746.1 hypothetical protein KDD30_00770 [Photobacterium sp. GJ3]
MEDLSKIVNHYSDGSTSHFFDNFFDSSSQRKNNLIEHSKVKRCANEIIQYVISDEFVEGEISKTQLYLEKLHLENPLLFRESFTSAWVKLYHMTNPRFLYVFASVASCLPYEWLKAHGITLILGCSSHQDPLVNEACIRMAEAWEQPEHAAYLEKMRDFHYDWLQSYKLETILYLKELEG